MQNITNIMSTQYHLSQIGSMSGKISVRLMEKKIQFCQNTVVCFRKAEVAYILLWIFMLVAWSSILIGNLTNFEESSFRNQLDNPGLVFTFRVNRHHCENCRSQTLCRWILIFTGRTIPVFHPISSSDSRYYDISSAGTKPKRNSTCCM